ncbi:MAG: hypothetical protein SNJ72_00325 [Fimbriimonadales bacterium]
MPQMIPDGQVLFYAMWRLLIGCFVCFCLTHAVGVAQSVEAIQQEIQALRARLTEMEALKARLEQLEAQLARLQPSPASAPVRVTGYLQFRYLHDTSLAQDSDNLERRPARDAFITRRARVDVIARPIPNTLFRLNLDAGSGTAQIRDVFVERSLAEGHLTVGLFRVPLLEEVRESSTDRLFPERTQMANSLFPTARDLGLAWRRPLSPQTTLTVGLFSGQRTVEGQASVTSRKSVLSRLDWEPTPAVHLWAGWMEGEGRRDYGGSVGLRNHPRRRAVLGAEWNPSPQWSLRAEGITGLDANLETPTSAEVEGWYAQLIYRVPDTPLIFYARRDDYDPNTQRGGDYFQRYGLGMAYQIDSATRLSLTWEQEQAPVRSELWTTQLQVQF